ncbi:MAG: hypothetical protein BroJett021_43670 [Chloroflexota bacterium]|jgi:hypothetical protein|nr:MAG: hypothetical protein BroJett021_43670 [Chloroflexota bacterium]
MTLSIHHTRRRGFEHRAIVPGGANRLTVCRRVSYNKIPLYRFPWQTDFVNQELLEIHDGF